jgi:hypothetical protein
MAAAIPAPNLQQHTGDPQNVPIPDPSLLTTAALARDIKNLRELLETKLGSSANANELIRSIIETRLDGMDKAIMLLQDSADRFPLRIDEKIDALRNVHEQKFTAMIDTHSEKFNSIQTQFKERDVRTEQSSKDSKVAVDAALQAAKEAVGEQNKSSALAISKSEASTTKQIDQLSVLIGQQQKGFDDKINDVKDRLTRAEGAKTGMKDGWGYLVAGIGVALALYSFSAKQAVVIPTPVPQVVYVPAPTGAMLPTPAIAPSVNPSIVPR